jgi:hypothetical protein
MCNFSQKSRKIRFLQYFEFSSTKTRFFEDEKEVNLDHRLKTNRHMYIKGKKKIFVHVRYTCILQKFDLCKENIISERWLL